MANIDFGTLFFAAIFTNNILLTNFLGLCPFLSISREVRSSLGLGVAVVFVMTCTAIINYLVYYYVLVPLNLDHFRFIVFIIIIACINFMNLSTARSAGRAREVGLRKVMGSFKGQLVWQFLTESFIMVVIALLLALLLVELALPFFQDQAHVSLSLNYFSKWYIIPALIGFAMLVGLLAGAYPAFFLALSAVDPSTSLRVDAEQS